MELEAAQGEPGVKSGFKLGGLFRYVVVLGMAQSLEAAKQRQRAQRLGARAGARVSHPTELGDALVLLIKDTVNDTGIDGVPLATSVNTTGVVTIVYAHDGLIGNDIPIRVDHYGGTGITFSPAEFPGLVG